MGTTVRTKCKHRALKLLAKIAVGITWLLTPSAMVFTVGFLVGPYMNWTTDMIYLASTNAFILWAAIQITFLGCLRHMRHKIRADIEAYHDEFVALRYWTAEPGSPKTDLDTLKSLKQKLLASTRNAGS
jgi:hypothetical protein